MLKFTERVYVCLCRGNLFYVYGDENYDNIDDDVDDDFIKMHCKRVCLVSGHFDNLC